MRLDRRTVLGAVLAVAAALVAFVATRPPPSEPILVAATPLAVGTPLTPDMIAVRRVTDSEGMVGGDDRSAVAGWSIVAPLEAGEPLVPSLMREPERRSAPDVMAVAVDTAAAVAGRLRGGDLVDIYVTTPSGPDGESATERISDSVLVVDTVTDAGLGGVGDTSVLLAVDRQLAALIAAAIHSGEIDLVRVGR